MARAIHAVLVERTTALAHLVSATATQAMSVNDTVRSLPLDPQPVTIGRSEDASRRAAGLHELAIGKCQDLLERCLRARRRALRQSLRYLEPSAPFRHVA